MQASWFRAAAYPPGNRRPLHEGVKSLGGDEEASNGVAASDAAFPPSPPGRLPLRRAGREQALDRNAPSPLLAGNLAGAESFQNRDQGLA